MRFLILFLMAMLSSVVPAQGTTGLHVAMLGDSNTFIGGNDCTGERGWSKWFAEQLHPSSCHSYARSGATWTHTPQTTRNTTFYSEVLTDDNVVSNQVYRLCDTCATGRQPIPDLIIIMAGTNDAWFVHRRPMAFCADTTTGSLTLAGAVTLCCKQLRSAFPQASIVLVTPLQTTAAPLERIQQTGNIIEQCGRQMDIPVIRLDRESCISCNDEQRRRHYTTDGTHTSVAGAREVGTLLAHRIKELLQPTTKK